MGFYRKLLSAQNRRPLRAMSAEEIGPGTLWTALRKLYASQTDCESKARITAKNSIAAPMLVRRARFIDSCISAAALLCLLFGIVSVAEASEGSDYQLDALPAYSGLAAPAFAIADFNGDK